MKCRDSSEVTIHLNSWATQERVSVIAENHQSILALKLNGYLWMEFMQGEKVSNIIGEGANEQEERGDKDSTNDRLISVCHFLKYFRKKEKSVTPKYGQIFLNL